MALGIIDDFICGDKIIYGIIIGKVILFFGLWLVMMMVVYIVGVLEEGWVTYYYYVNVIFFIVMLFVVMVWLSIGGICDLLWLYWDLKIV